MTPIIALGEEDVARLLGALALPIRTSTPLAAPIGSLDVEVSALAATLLAGEIHLRATGTATARGAGGGAVSAPFSLELPLAVALPVTPDLDHAIELRRTGSPSLTASGALGALLTPLAPLVGGFVADAALPGLRQAIDDAVPRAVAATFGLVDLPRRVGRLAAAGRGRTGGAHDRRRARSVRERALHVRALRRTNQPRGRIRSRRGSHVR